MASKRRKLGKVVARCIDCGGEATVNESGYPPFIKHKVDCPNREKKGEDE